MTKTPKDLERIEAAASGGADDASGKPAGGGKRRTPVDMGHYGISIDSEGEWSHGGTPFPRIALAKLFATVLKRDADGRYWLETPVERGQVDVADAPFVAVELRATGVGEGQDVSFRTNLDDWVPLDDAHRLRIDVDPETGEPRPYVHVRGGLEARLLRPVFYELAELAVENATGETMGVWSGGLFHEVGPAETDE